jgi:large subunit ribosomal protein L10
MPTDAKRAAIDDLRDRLSRATIAIATDFSGIKVNDLTELRKRLRAEGLEYHVVKNRLAAIAAREAGAEALPEILDRATGLVIGFGDPVAAAKVLDAYVKDTRSAMAVRKGYMDGVVLAEKQVSALAALPPRDELIAKLLGQMNAPISGLVNVLSGPVRGLAIVLQRRAEQLSAA